MVRKQACVSAWWHFSVAAENSPSVNRLYSQPVRRWKGTLRLGVCWVGLIKALFVFTALIKALFLFSQPATCMLYLVRTVVATAVAIAPWLVSITV